MSGHAGDDHIAIRGYRPADLEACRSLWAELTEWHRVIYASPELGGPDPGRQFDGHLECVGPVVSQRWRRGERLADKDFSV